jgi:outer membrane protein assembly factor BamD
MKMKKSVVYLLCFIFIALFFSCSKKNIRPVVEPDPLYNEAMQLFNNGKYEKASKKFLEFKNRFPFDKRIIEVEIKYCDSLYKAEEYAEAEVAYLDFIKLHPKHKLVAYAYYQLGMVQFKQISTIDRDQSKLYNAYKYFSILLEKFPNTNYAIIANHRVLECKRKIAKNNFYVGYFYFKQGKYKAAIARFERILTKYPGFIDDKVLYYLGKCYIDINEKDKGKTVLNKLVEKYPKSRYTFRAKQILKKMKPDKFHLWARIEEYYFTNESDVNDTYCTPGYRKFAYPPSPDLPTSGYALSKQSRIFTSLETSQELKKEYEKTELSAQESGAKNKIPVNVSANEVEYIDNNTKVIFTGDVVVSRGDMTIKCTKLTAFLNKDSKSISKVIATGDVAINYLTKEGHCDKAVYFVNESKLVLTGDPYLKDGDNILTGDKVIYFTNNQRIFVMGTPKKRSRILLKGE